MAVIATWSQKIPSLRLTPGSCFLEEYSAPNPRLLLKHTARKYGIKVPFQVFFLLESCSLKVSLFSPLDPHIATLAPQVILCFAIVMLLYVRLDFQVNC